MISLEKFNDTKLKIFDLESINHSMNKAYLLIGGNMGDRYDNLKKAMQLLASEVGRIAKTSNIYETAAWGLEDQPSFLNQAVLLETELLPNELMHSLLEIEQKMGRKREVKFGPRIIDIDILLFDKRIVKNENLVIPHPELPNRKFALIPLNELEPGIIHPETGETIEEMLRNCKDKLPVDKKNQQSSL